jgi:hypothetical protein
MQDDRLETRDRGSSDDCNRSSGSLKDGEFLDC